MPNQAAQLSQIFQALSDPTRRAVLERLCQGSAAMSELARPFNMALPSFSQHLDVLERCGLVRSRKSGRVRIYTLAPQPLGMAEHWMTRQRAIWERRLDQLDLYLQDLKEQKR
ncbi:DNA-binding helix-turn-helix protein [Bordetella bronchiseptica MBORD762]|uniref:ArsR/SmtB family transcription factor n=1 Tax=Bordetella bronchiseptica TaxID=518 RepID=UPI000460B6EF|nr:metalloregulator ArsR/SmtB family transcription factor [Bordetella bronchiseptica]KDD93119.1 DNA-binding helix-turn-helix protein [Bordetella bronchiseptica MBORD762]